MGNITIARRYAKAFSEFVSERGIVDETGKDLELIGNITQCHPYWLSVLADSTTPLAERLNMIDELADSAGLQTYTGNFLKLLVEKKRITLLQEVIKEIKTLGLRLKGEREASVTVADGGVWSDLKDEVEDVVRKICGGVVKLNHKVDPSIIGGLIIRVGDTLYDGSIRGELKRVREHLIAKMMEI